MAAQIRHNKNQSQECYTAGAAVELSASMDYATQELLNENTYYSPYNFILYRSTHSGGPYTAIATNVNIYPPTPTIFYDTNAVVGQTNYYVVTFQAINNSTGVTNESPFSNEIAAPGRNPGLLLTATNVWNVVTNASNPANVVRLQAPFSSEFPNQYATLLPLPNTLWPVGTTWSNSTTFVVPSNSVPLSQVVYAIAIDNDYQLYLNGTSIETNYHEGYADWSSSKSFESVATNLLHYGTNDIRIMIVDEGNINYFSMVVTTNTCGQ